jgi:ribonuclease HII
VLRNFFLKDTVEAGCDEAGRGCLAGPVFAAAVILPLNFRHPLLNDSKQLNAEERALLRPIIEKKAIAWAVASADNVEIDLINILQASILSMHRALDKLSLSPAHILVDGNRFKPYKDIPHTCIVEGDAKYKCIAAASILAKTYRDDFMAELHKKHDVYGWDTNKGYGTPIHREAIEVHGLTDYHRKSFRLFYNQEELEQAE